MNNAPQFEFDPARLFRTMEKNGHSKALGLRYVGHGDDWAEIRMPWRPDLVGDVEKQTMATGAISGLVDMASGVSVWTRLYTFRPQATLDLRIDYMRAANPRADMVARAECYRVAREIAFVRGVAHDGDIADPVASFSACFMFTGPAMMPGDRSGFGKHLGGQS
jgi:uncharacterized protein (TIGR00369 family)